MLPSLAVAAVLGIGGVGAGAVLVSSDGHPSDPSAATVRRVVPPVSVTSPHPSTPAPPVTSAPAPPARAPRTPDFAVTVVGRVSWVSVVGPHGRVLYAGLLRHGRSLSYAQRPLTVTLGDAGAVQLVLHHKVRPHAGRRGQVLRLTYR